MNKNKISNLTLGQLLDLCGSAIANYFCEDELDEWNEFLEEEEDDDNDDEFETDDKSDSDPEVSNEVADPFRPEGETDLPRIATLPRYTGTDEDYFKESGLNWSTLKRFLDDPRTFSQNSQEGPTAAQSLGTIVHCKLLQPKLFNARYQLFEPPTNANGVPYKSGQKYDAAKAEFEASGKLAVTAEQIDTITQIENSLRFYGVDKYFHSLINDPFDIDYTHVSELALFDESGVDVMKCKIDLYHEKYGIIDLKTTSSKLFSYDNNKSFIYGDCFRYGYFYQLAWYREVFRRVTGHLVPCSILAVQTEYPYQCGLFRMSSSRLDAAWGKITSEFLPEYNNAVTFGNIKTREIDVL